MRPWVRSAAWSAAGAALLAVVVVGSAAIGPVRIPPETVMKSVLNAVAVPAGIETSAGGVGPLPIPGVGPLTIPSVDLAFASPFAFPVDSVHQQIVVGV
ncbi:iron ABC transporter, partial [Halorubrum sp. E3]